MASTLEGRPVAVVAPGAGPDQHRGYVDWPAIIAGAVLASAISFVLLTFGSAIGLAAATDTTLTGNALLALLAASALWLLWVQVSSFAAGGYIAGRMRRRLHDATEHEVHVRDGLHGVLVWGLGILLGGVLAAAAITGAARGGLEIAKAGIAAAGEAAGGALADQGPMAALGLGDMTYDLDRLLRGSAPAAGVSVTTGTTTGTMAAAEPASDPRAERDEIGRIVTTGLASETGDVPEEDRAYIASVVAENAGISQQEARQRVDAFIDETRAAAEEASVAAEEAAETARQLGVLLAFTAAASLLLSAAAAWWGARRGGRHRDEGTVMAFLVPGRRV